MKIDSTIEELSLYNYWVDISEPATRVNKKFKENPNLPGVILTKERKLVGLVSQKKFWQYMSRPFSISLSSQRSIEYIHKFIEDRTLILSRNTTIIEAAKKSLQRPAQQLQDPIIVKITEQQYKLLDVRQLLIAQAKIYETTNLIIIDLYKNLQKANQKLKLFSSIDGLTNLSNTRIFKEYLEREWKLGIKERKHLALILCDLDYFGRYNQIYGHLAGDDCLRKIAKAIEKSVKVSGGLTSRYRDDEIAIILPNTNDDRATILAENISKNIRELAILNQGSKVSEYITLSIGIASIIPNDKTTIEKFLLAAERSVCKAKRSGRNCQIVFNKVYGRAVVL